MPIFNARELIIILHLFGYLADDAILRTQLIKKIKDFKEPEYGALHEKIYRMFNEELKRS